MAKRGLILATVVVSAIGLAACGRATEEQINQALGITPTPTQSAEEIAQATAAASATALAREQAAATPGGGAAVFLGDATAGKMTFTMWCAACHGPGGNGGNILEPGGVAAAYTPEKFTALVREGAGHNPPGPYQSFQISDRALEDLGAYVNAESNK